MRLRQLAGLEERDFRVLFLARASSLLGDGLVGVALAFAVLEVDSSASALGLVLAARSVPQVVFLLVGGVIADRLRRSQVMVGSDLLSFAAQGTAAVLVITGAAELWHLAALAFLYGGASAFFLPASTGLVPQTISPARLQQANGLLSLTSSAFFVLGPAIAGVLVATVGPGVALAVDAGTFLASAGFLSRLRIPGRVEAPSSSFLGELRAGWREFRSRTWLWVDGVYSALGNLAVMAPLWTLGPVVAKESLGGAPAWATIATAFGLGSVLAGVAALRIRPARPLVAGVTTLLFLGLPCALLAIPAPTGLIAAGALAAGFGLIFFNTLFETTVQQYVPPAALSRVASIDWVLSLGLQPIGFAAAGPLAEIFGTAQVLVASSVWIVISTAVVLAFPGVRAVRRLEGPPAEARA